MDIAFYLFYLLVEALPLLLFAVVCCVYLIMGIKQLMNGYREKSMRKKKAGQRTIVISVLLLMAISLFYFRYVKP